MSILVRPLRKTKKDLQFVSENERKGANSVLAGKMPTIFVATREQEDGTHPTEFGKDVAVVGFRYRRQSHHCELTWWCGDDQELAAEAIRAIQCQAVLEGRKRVECFSEQNQGAPYPRGGDMFDGALKRAEMRHEGFHADWTKYFEDVNVWGWVWLQDGLPEFKTGTKVVLGTNETVFHYRGKNIELYIKDRDYYSRVDDGKGLSFADHIKNAITYVEGLPEVQIVQDWSPKD